MTTTKPNELKTRAQALKLYGLLAHWNEVCDSDWLEPLLLWEEAERQRRSLERRLKGARLGAFKPLADFDWAWPKQCDRAAIEELMQLDFLDEASNVVLVGPNGVGKSTVACNIAHQAVLRGHTVIFITAAQLLNELAAQDSDRALRQKLSAYARAALLCVDEVGYLSYGIRHADLLFEIVSQRYREKKSMLITTNRPFADWAEVFPNAACVVSLIDRLVHKAEIIPINGESYRLKESRERSAQRKKQRSKRTRPPLAEPSAAT